MKKIMFYCQHVLGMGHFIRSMSLVEGLHNFQVCFLNGGEPIPGFQFPPQIEVVHLPPIKSDANFSGLHTDGTSLSEIQQIRTRQLLQELDRFQPDALIIELFPFGRKKFSFELIPLLARIRRNGRSTRVICSLRDILVKRPDQPKYEARVVSLLNRYFDALLIHADPRFQKLEETFSRVQDLAIDILYTGYVVQPPPQTETSLSHLPASRSGPLILASIGGGRVGHELIEATLAASALLQETMPHHLLVFTGPYMPEAQFQQLAKTAVSLPHVTFQRFTNRFLAYMAQADLSISMAGYNTCMNILTTHTPALVLPFTGGENNEQQIRTRKLAELGAITPLSPEDLEPTQLAAKIRDALHQPINAVPLNVDGVQQTAVYLERLLAHPPAAKPLPFLLPANKRQRWQTQIHDSLAPELDRLAANGRTVSLFLRDDDTDEEEATLHELLDITLSHQVPISLAVIPGRLTCECARFLRQTKKQHPQLVELHQHGWLHLNHERTGRKCEFGISRSFDAQLADIAQGKAQLETLLREYFFPAFTPPWNRCTADTLAVLDRLGFAVFSRDRHDTCITGYNFQEISVTLDIFTWKGGKQLKRPSLILAELTEQLHRLNPIGILLHHKVMDAEAFTLVDILLNELRLSPAIQFHTLETLLTSIPTPVSTAPY